MQGGRGNFGDGGDSFCGLSAAKKPSSAEPCARGQYPIRRLQLSPPACKRTGAPVKVKQASDVAELVVEHYKDLAQEAVLLLLMKSNNEVASVVEMSLGGIGTSAVDLRLVLGVVLAQAVPAFIMAHNHPSGSREPSDSDKQLTEAVQRGARGVGLNFLDHVIVTPNGSHFSFVENGLMTRG